MLIRKAVMIPSGMLTASAVSQMDAHFGDGRVDQKQAAEG